MPQEAETLATKTLMTTWRNTINEDASRVPCPEVGTTLNRMKDGRQTNRRTILVGRDRSIAMLTREAHMDHRTRNENQKVCRPMTDGTTKTMTRGNTTETEGARITTTIRMANRTKADRTTRKYTTGEILVELENISTRETGKASIEIAMSRTTVGAPDVASAVVIFTVVSKAGIIATENEIVICHWTSLEARVAPDGP
jgi:hypothetical protein